MRKIFNFWLLFFSTISIVGAQDNENRFAPERLQVRFGYHLHNTGANRFNYLINAYNNERYPLRISENLPSLNFLHGFSLGGGYELNDRFLPFIVLKNKHQTRETYELEAEGYRFYTFREHTMELGLHGVLSGQKNQRFRQYAGAALLLGALTVHTGNKDTPGQRDAPKGTRVDQAAVVGLTLDYEAQLILTDFLALYLRPVLQVSIPTEVRNLNAFMNPVYENEQIVYRPVEPEKYNRGTLNGVGLEGGLILLVPEISFAR